MKKLINTIITDPTSVNILNTKEEADKLNEVEKQAYEGWRFAIQHGEKYDSKNAPLHDVFRSLRKWSEDHPSHHVVTICLDLKGGAAYHGDHGHFVNQLDSAIKWVSEPFLLPSSLLSSYSPSLPITLLIVVSEGFLL